MAARCIFIHDAGSCSCSEHQSSVWVRTAATLHHFYTQQCKESFQFMKLLATLLTFITLHSEYMNQYANNHPNLKAVHKLVKNVEILVPRPAMLSYCCASPPQHKQSPRCPGPQVTRLELGPSHYSTFFLLQRNINPLSPLWRDERCIMLIDGSQNPISPRPGAA